MIGWIFRLSQALAMVGGVVLCALTLLVVSSITGRALVGAGLGPVPGDFELVEIGTAVAVFCFLPLTYLRNAHATVDLLYTQLPRALQKAVVLISDLLMLTLWLALTWQLWIATLEKREYMETTFILQLPVWWAYALCLVGGIVGCMAYITKTLIECGCLPWPEGWSREAAPQH